MKNLTRYGFFTEMNKKAGASPIITEDGGTTCKDKLFVNEIPYVNDYKTVVYDKSNIFDIIKDAYPNGISFLIMPFASEVAMFYSREAPNVENLLMTPIIGWIIHYPL